MNPAEPSSPNPNKRRRLKKLVLPRTAPSLSNGPKWASSNKRLRQ